MQKEKREDLTGRKFEDVYEKFYDPKEVERRKVSRMRKERTDNTRDEAGL